MQQAAGVMTARGQVRAGKAGLYWPRDEVAEGTGRGIQDGKFSIIISFVPGEWRFSLCIDFAD